MSFPGKNSLNQGEINRLFGSDIWFDVTQGVQADLAVTAGGDWVPVSDDEALRQAVIRRIITNPGEWQTLPDFGAGARLFLKAKNTPSARQELEERIRGQLSQDVRVGRVTQVVVEFLDSGQGLRISVQFLPAGQRQRREPLVASVEVT